MDSARRSQPPPMAMPWLLGVARHKLADHYRRRATRETLTVAEVPEVDPADTEALGAALRSLSGDPALAAGMAERGRARALRRPWSAAAGETLRVYAELLR